MDQRIWLEQLEAKLRRSGLPSTYVERTCHEYLDHAEEAQAAGRTAAMLGSCPDELASNLVRSYRYSGYLRRIPPICLLPLPPLMSVFVPLCYYVLAGELIEFVLNDPFDRTTPLLKSQLLTVQGFYYFGKVVSPLIAVFLLQWIARKMARPWGWSVGLFALLAMASFCTTTQLDLGSHSPDLSLSFDTDLPSDLQVLAWQLLQSGFVLAVGAWCAMRLQRQQKTSAV